MRALQDDGRIWVAPATIDGKVGLRPCFVNFRTTDEDVRARVEIADELAPRGCTPDRVHSGLLSPRNTGLTPANPRSTPMSV